MEKNQYSIMFLTTGYFRIYKIPTLTPHIFPMHVPVYLKRHIFTWKINPGQIILRGTWKHLRK